MLFNEIQPFVRFVHHVPLNRNSKYISWIPYDARIFYCYNGSGVIQVNNSLFPMTSGCVLILPSGTSYHLITPEYEVSYIGVNFDYTLDYSNKKTPIEPARQAVYDPSERLGDVQFHDNVSFNNVIYLKNAGSLSHSFFKLQKEYTQKLIYYEHLCSDILATILIECSRIVSAQKYGSNDKNIATVIGYIQENYMQEITNQMIGEVLGMHPNYVNSMFKSYTGIPLHQYVMRIRISHAIELLQGGNLSIGEIAALCGFCDIYHFSKCFKKSVGVTPSKYRSQ